MTEILGATGSSSPINPIRKKELDSKWKNIVAKAVTDEDFKKKLVKDPMPVIEQEGLKPLDQLKIQFDEVTKIHKVGIVGEADDEITTEAKWWTIRLKMIKEFGVELNRQVGTVAVFEEGTRVREII